MAKIACSFRGQFSLVLVYLLTVSSANVQDSVDCKLEQERCGFERDVARGNQGDATHSDTGSLLQLFQASSTSQFHPPARFQELSGLPPAAASKFSAEDSSFVGVAHQTSSFGEWSSSEVSQLVAHWSPEKQAKLQRMANKTLWEVLQYSAIPQDPQGHHYFVQAGQLPQMWLRDSTASVHHFFTTGLVDREPYAKKVAEGLARTLAKYIAKDARCSAWEPYDNGRECRGGGTYTDMRFELDSPMYVLRMFRMLRAHGSDVPLETDSKEAVSAILKLAEELMGREGLLKTESRPSDDTARGFNIPDNFFAAVELSLLSRLVGDSHVIARGKNLSQRIVHGIATYGTKIESGFGKVFCYEATEGECLIMDDANVPSLIALPYLDNGTNLLDMETYSRTRKMLLSNHDPYYYESQNRSIAGIGSPHVPGRRVWPMSMISQALTANNAEEVAHMLNMIVDTDAGKELIHESVHVDNPLDFTRPWFDWPNSLFAELVDKCCSDLCGTRAKEMPAIPFDGWQTCGFRDGMCTLDGTSFASQDISSIESDAAAEVCVRFGAPFVGYHYRRRSLHNFPLHCVKDEFGTHENGAFHCALAESARCGAHGRPS